MGGLVDPHAEPPGAARAQGLCGCGHALAAHEHYRRGSDCGICGAAKCAAYRRPRNRLWWMLRRALLRRRDLRR